MTETVTSHGIWPKLGPCINIQFLESYRVTYMGGRKRGNHCFKWCLVTCSVPKHCLNQFRLLVKWASTYSFLSHIEWRIWAAGNGAIIVSNDVWSPVRCQNIVLTNSDFLSNGPLGTCFGEFRFKIQYFLFRKMYSKMWYGKWHPFCLAMWAAYFTWDPIYEAFFIAIQF